MEQEKISDLIGKSQKENTILMSFEVFPEDSFQLDKLNIVHKYSSFISIAWKLHLNIKLADINTKNVDTIPAIALAYRISNMGYTVLLHLTCIDMKKKTLKYILEHIKSHSIKNLLILQGDRFNESSEGEFEHVSDMIFFIREHYGDYFCLGIAGFPNGHPDSKNLEDYIKYLKFKVEVGADFIITQIFYGFEEFERFVGCCRNSGIDIPIIPGLCIFPSYKVLQRMVNITHLELPEHFNTMIEMLTNDDIEFTNVMKYFIINLINKLLESKMLLSGIHWFSFNKLEMINDVILGIPALNKQICYVSNK